MQANALVIGCGRIGAACDLADRNPDSVNDSYSHAKALFMMGKHDLYFYDRDIILSRSIAEKYNGRALESLDYCKIEHWDWVSIATPTQTHLSFYRNFAGKSKYLLLEKPLAYSTNDCMEIHNIWKSTKQLTYVNYMRDFLPPYSSLRSKIIELEKVAVFSDIRITYHRGLVNNFSHALSLLSLLIGESIEIQNPKIFSTKVFEENPEDPTVSFGFEFNNRQFLVLGLDEKQYPILDIELFSKTHVVRISNSGDLIQIFSRTTFDIFGIKLREDFREENVLKDFMGSVVRSIYSDSCVTDENLESAFAINMELLGLCQSLR